MYLQYAFRIEIKLDAFRYAKRGKEDERKTKTKYIMQETVALEVLAIFSNSVGEGMIAFSVSCSLQSARDAVGSLVLQHRERENQ